MRIAPPQPALDQSAVNLFRDEMPPGAIPPGKAALAENIAGASPFLRQLMLRDPVFAGRVFSADAFRKTMEETKFEWQTMSYVEG